MVRTRSQTMSQKDDHLGKIVVAHKGKLIPCWFPGKIEEKTSKGYLVQFLAKSESEECTPRNILSFDEFLKKKKNETSGLFKVPAKLRDSYEEAFKLASEQLK